MTGTARLSAAHPAHAAPPSLDVAYQHCAAVTKRCARNFYYGLRLTPEPRRSAIYSVYAWMRYADDLVDAAADLDTKAERLAGLTRDMERMLSGGLPSGGEADPVWAAFAETVRRYRIDPAELRRLLRGLETDLGAERRAAESREPALICQTREDLREYCHCVASTVGIICVTIWGLRPGASPDHARHLAIERGQAFQMTNILRDFARDYDEGRVYLPTQDFSHAGLTPRDLRRWADPAKCEAFVLAQARLARGRYEASAELESLVDPSCVAALAAMTQIYSGLLGVVERHPARIVGDARIRLPSAQKAGIAISAFLRAFAARRFGRAS